MLTTRMFGKAHCRPRSRYAALQRRFMGCRSTNIDVDYTELAERATTRDVPQPQASSFAAVSSTENASSGTFYNVIATVNGKENVNNKPKVAELDAQRFRLHPSVSFWQDYTTPINAIWENTGAGVTSAAQELVSRISGGAVLSDPQAATYWAYHTARLSFFIAQGVASLTAHYLSESLPSSATRLQGLDSAPQAPQTDVTRTPTPLERIMANAGREMSTRVGEALTTWQQDYDNIKAGCYPLPWDMSPTHRQSNPLFVLRQSVESVRETVTTLQRRVGNTPDHVWLNSGLYPQYYTKTFHYQTDGWFSDRSARVYELNTEMLFFGRQDAMQRTSLLPLAEYVREARQMCRSTAELRLLEVAAGTGRFHTFIKDAHPDMKTVVSDLSPFYLARARENMSYWKRTRQPGRSLGGVDDTGTEFLQSAAEALAAPDESFDVVVSVYLFHELPETIRRAAAAEFYRVLRPGGLVVLTDSVQLGDRPAWDNTIGLFGDFNEPYYRNYVSCDLGAMFEEAGFVCDTKYLCSATKTLSFRKPAGPLE